MVYELKISLLNVFDCRSAILEEKLMRFNVRTATTRRPFSIFKLVCQSEVHEILLRYLTKYVLIKVKRRHDECYRPHQQDYTAMPVMLNRPVTVPFAPVIIQKYNKPSIKRESTWILFYLRRNTETFTLNILLGTRVVQTMVTKVLKAYNAFASTLPKVPVKLSRCRFDRHHHTWACLWRKTHSKRQEHSKQIPLRKKILEQTDLSPIVILSRHRFIEGTYCFFFFLFV